MVALRERGARFSPARVSSLTWRALALGAVVAVAVVGPVFLPYAALQRTGQLDRSLAEAARWSADWRSYLASGSRAHSWLLGVLGEWKEVLFPGIVATLAGGAGLFLAGRDGAREHFRLYGGLAGLALWASFRPTFGLYDVLYRVVPVFSLLHAPSRFGLVVGLAWGVLGGLALARLFRLTRHATALAAALVVISAAELAVRIDFAPVPRVSPAYRTLATLPPAPVVELPFYESRMFYPKHTIYMLGSTAHWMPMLNGYSDSYPDDFRDTAVAVAPFPYPPAFQALKARGVRYAMFHLDFYDAPTRAQVEGRLLEYAAYLKPLSIGADERLYEIVGAP